MGWEVIKDKESETIGFFCNTADVCFGPIIYNEDKQLEKQEIYDHFIDKDPRLLTEGEIRNEIYDLMERKEK
jgi:flagellar motor component MotA